MRLFYLTTAHHAIANIQKKRIKVALFNDLNDPFELLCSKLPNRQLRRGFRNVKNEINRRIGVICFSTEWRSSVMWAHYGDKHKGICLGFDVPDEYAISITYLSTRDAAAAEAFLERRRPDDAFAHRMMTSKHDAWKYENERRLYVGLEECDAQTGLYFYDFGANLRLREIILGARCTVTMSEARKLAKTDGAVAYKARLAFNTYDVVANRNTLRQPCGTA